MTFAEEQKYRRMNVAMTRKEIYIRKMNNKNRRVDG